MKHEDDGPGMLDPVPVPVDPDDPPPSTGGDDPSPDPPDTGREYPPDPPMPEE